MSLELRGGIPRIRRYTATTTGHKTNPPGVTKHVQISNDGANALRVYFTKADFDADAAFGATDGFIQLAASTGFYEGPAEIGSGSQSNPDLNGLWLRGVVGDATGQILWYLRRG